MGTRIILFSDAKIVDTRDTFQRLALYVNLFSLISYRMGQSNMLGLSYVLNGMDWNGTTILQLHYTFRLEYIVPCPPAILKKEIF